MNPFLSPNGNRLANAIYRNQLIVLHKLVADVLSQTAPNPQNNQWPDSGKVISENIAHLQVAQLLLERIIKAAGVELGATLEEQAKVKPASEPTKAPSKYTCGDCDYFHGPTWINRYGKEIGKCYAQNDAPTVEEDKESCDKFDWNGGLQ